MDDKKQPRGSLLVGRKLANGVSILTLSSSVSLCVCVRAKAAQAKV